jgi:hypothetical protein
MMPNWRHEPAAAQHPEGALLGRVEDDRVCRCTVANESHNTVAASVGPLHHAAVAIDRQGCHGHQVVMGQ